MLSNLQYRRQQTASSGSSPTSPKSASDAVHSPIIGSSESHAPLTENETTDFSRRMDTVLKKEEMFMKMGRAEDLYNMGRFQASYELFAAAEQLIKEVYDPQLDSNVYFALLAK